MNTLIFSKKNIRHYLLFLLAILCIHCFSQDASTAKNNAVVSYINTKFPDKIQDVIVNKNNVIVQGAVSGTTQNIYLCELEMFDETKTVSNSFTSVTPINLSGQNFQIKLSRFATGSNGNYDRIYSRWMIALKKGNSYQAQSYAHYAENINDAALQYLPEEKPRGKKGLEGFFQESNEADLKDLDIKNVTVNITLPEVISLAPTEYSYRFNNQTYYINPKTVSLYDHQFKTCSDDNVFVSAVILIQQNIAANIKSILVHPGANAGVQSMANITSQNGFNYYAALIGFLAERYSRPDKKYGRISNWIIHNEVDNGAYWANAGAVKMEDYTQLYDRSMRTVYYTVRQYNPAAKVFISLTHSWASATQAKFYPPKDMLEFLNEMCKKQGDYEWGVAFHPYSEDIFSPITWNDKDATMDLNTTKFITPKNIELIDAWMRMPNHLYKGQKVRTLLFSEQGVNAKSYSKEDELMQAAGIAYMWKKCSRLPSVESFDYHRQSDNRNEHGLMFGLWTSQLGTIATPGRKKTSWYIYQKAETPSEDSALAFALPIIKINNWAQAYNNITGNVMPCTVTFNIRKNGNPVNNVSVHFDGEMHKTINGSATFYNVASLSASRDYVIRDNTNAILKKQSVVINKSQVISVNM